MAKLAFYLFHSFFFFLRQGGHWFYIAVLLDVRCLCYSAKSNPMFHFCLFVSCNSKVLLTFATAVYFGCYKMMVAMAKVTHSDSGALIDGGMDLNAESGTAEYHFYLTDNTSTPSTPPLCQRR